VGMDGKTGKSIQGIKEEIYKRTSVSSTKFRQKIRMKVDVSDYAMGGVLLMECKDGK